jgi:hypothetical protein
VPERSQGRVRAQERIQQSFGAFRRQGSSRSCV